jgi:hypothetical protein
VQESPCQTQESSLWHVDLVVHFHLHSSSHSLSPLFQAQPEAILQVLWAMFSLQASVQEPVQSQAMEAVQSAVVAMSAHFSLQPTAEL